MPIVHPGAFERLPSGTQRLRHVAEPPSSRGSTALSMRSGVLPTSRGSTCACAYDGFYQPSYCTAIALPAVLPFAHGVHRRAPLWRPHLCSRTRIVPPPVLPLRALLRRLVPMWLQLLIAAYPLCNGTGANGVVGPQRHPLRRPCPFALSQRCKQTFRVPGAPTP